MLTKAKSQQYDPFATFLHSCDGSREINQSVFDAQPWHQMSL